MRGVGSVSFPLTWVLRKICASVAVAASSSLRTLLSPQLCFPNGSCAGTLSPPAQGLTKSTFGQFELNKPRCIASVSTAILAEATRQSIIDLPGAGGRLQQYWLSNTGCRGPSGGPSVGPA